MQEHTLLQLCLALSITSALWCVLTYTPSFTPTSIAALTQAHPTGIIFGRVEHVIRSYPTTVFTLTDGTTALVYYPKPTVLENNSFVTVYVSLDSNTEQTVPRQEKSSTKNAQALYAHKLVISS